MRRVYRVAEVRAAERALMATLPPGVLMRRAAGGLASHCVRLLGERLPAGPAGGRRGGVYGAPVLLLIGAGDNGGDALYAGATLARRGAAVAAVLLAPDRAHADGLADLRRAGGRVVDHPPDRLDLVVDGIVGIGGRGGLREAAVAALTDATAATGRDGRRPTVVAVDVPSGVEADTGAVTGAAVRADHTVTFGCLKPALVVGPAAPLAGAVELVDIGLGPWLPAEPALLVPEATDVAGWLPSPGPASDKYTRGVVGVATGSATYPGAAVLSVGGALAGPTGMVRYAGTAAASVLAHHPSVIATESVAEAGRVQAWVCGSGLGTDDRAAGELSAVLDTGVPVVLDADAVTLLAGDRADGVGAPGELGVPAVLTPHDREFARLAGGQPGTDRVAAAQALARQTGAVVLLKGDRTVVADPSGQVWVNPTGTPVLASGGTGDVLAGLLGSLLAAGLEPAHAAVAAAYLHGAAGRRAARRGPVTAPDVAAALRPVLRDLVTGEVRGPDRATTGASADR